MFEDELEMADGKTVDDEMSLFAGERKGNKEAINTIGRMPRDWIGRGS